MKSHHFLAVAVGALLLTGAGCASQTPPTTPQSGRLPNHITTVHGETLPKAIAQARQDGRTSVRVTDPRGQTVEVTVNSPVHTQVRYSVNTQSKEDVYGSLKKRGIDTSKFYDTFLSEDGTRGSFTTNTTNFSDIATLVYELAVGYQHIQSTAQWVIDIE